MLFKRGLGENHMQIEIISVSGMGTKMVHISSSEKKEIKFDKKTVFQQGIQYIEQYVNQSGFRILNAVSEAGGFMFILVKD
jgi:hypothetical protein